MEFLRVLDTKQPPVVQGGGCPWPPSPSGSIYMPNLLHVVCRQPHLLWGHEWKSHVMSRRWCFFILCLNIYTILSDPSCTLFPEPWTSLGWFNEKFHKIEIREHGRCFCHGRTFQHKMSEMVMLPLVFNSFGKPSKWHGHPLSLVYQIILEQDLNLTQQFYHAYIHSPHSVI